MGVLRHRALTERVIRLATEVHGTVGPGLLERVYARCPCLGLGRAGMPFESEFGVSIVC